MTISKIRRPSRRFYTAGRGNQRYLWWWAQQSQRTIPGAGIWNNDYTWNDNDVWRD